MPLIRSGNLRTARHKGSRSGIVPHYDLEPNALILARHPAVRFFCRTVRIIGFPRHLQIRPPVR
jgi:hypothetical protein